jgi:ESCRT-I complex subunit VPS28
LKLAAKDQVAPYLSDLLTSLYRVQQLPTDFAGTILVRHWIVRLDKMRASDELGDDEIRQLLYDTENSYNAFMRLLGGHEEHTRQGQSQVE